MTRIRASLIAALLAGLLVPIGAEALPTQAQNRTAQEVARKTFPSTVLLVLEDANGQPLSLGSGFFVRDGEVVSNLHVVEGGARGYAKIVGQKAKYEIEGVTAIDAERDLVLLKLSGARAPKLALGSSESAQVGEVVYAVGNPQGLEGTFSQGIVSSIREVGADKVLQITAPISPGSSGGPVLNGRGEVIGVSVATFSGGQNLNFAIPSDYLRALLGKAGPAKSLAQAIPRKAERSILAGLGGRGAEGVVGAQLTWDVPGNPYIGGYSFTLRNQLRAAVQKVYCLVIFRDSEGKALDVDLVKFDSVIPAGLARRVSGKVHSSIGVLTEWKSSAVEFRVLDFDIDD
jgi:hypothetical protein